MKEGEGFHAVFGTGPKNGMNGVTPGVKGCGEGRALDLSGLNSLLVADLDYFVRNHEVVLEQVKKQIERRDEGKKMTKTIFRLVCRVNSLRFSNRATVSLGDIFDAASEEEARELVNAGYAEVLSERER